MRAAEVSDDDGGLNGGEITGIVLGVILALFFVGAIFYFVTNRTKQKKKKKEEGSGSFSEAAAATAQNDTELGRGDNLAAAHKAGVDRLEQV